MRSLFPKIILTLCFAIVLPACNKPLLYGTIQEADAVVKNYEAPPDETFKAAKEALAFRGYSLKTVDEENKTIETYWQPSTADSHYVDVFGRPDYGTVGSYYRLVVKVSPRGTGSSVSITNVAKSFISNVKSSGRTEAMVFEKVADFTRKRDIQVTNIGLQ